jgi:AcrR family transcriptional regulator
MIDVAARMFFERGYDATSLQDIAEEVGLLKGSLYHYISAKDDLLWAIILRQHESALALAERCRRLDAPPDVRLAEFVRAYADSLELDYIYVSVYMHDLNRLSPERRERIINERHAYSTFVVDLLAEGRRCGVFRTDLDPTVAGHAILGLLSSAFRWYRPGSATTAHGAIEECLNLIVRGIAGDRPS